MGNKFGLSPADMCDLSFSQWADMFAEMDALIQQK